MLNKSKYQHPQHRLTAEEFETRIWGFVVIVVTLILAGIVSFMLYSLAFVVQPLKSMAPMDQAFAKMLNDIVLLVVGGIGGVMSRKGVQAAAEKLASPQPQAVAPSTTPVTTATGVMPDFNWMGIAPVQFDEEWRAPPPPTTAPDHLHPEREEIAQERAAAEMEKQ